jgi:hypothetical protein
MQLLLPRWTNVDKSSPQGRLFYIIRADGPIYLFCSTGVEIFVAIFMIEKKSF